MCVKLVTRHQWDRMSPKTQGYILYMQAKLPGSELKDVDNPYPGFTKAFRQFVDGEYEAILEIQDGEE